MNVIHEALSAPLGFPALSQTVFPGDRLLLVPDAECSARPADLSEIVATLLANSLAAEDISILLTEDADVESLRQTLKYDLNESIRIIIHEPQNRNRLAMLGVDAEDRPIILLRELIDADMIMTIERHHVRNPKNHFGLHSALYPRFSDTETRQRFKDAKGASRKKLPTEVAEVAHQLGVVFTIRFLWEKDVLLRVAAGLPDLVISALID